MKQLLSVWLVPQDEDKKYLQEIVNNLGKQYNTPLFTPHLTLVSEVMMELKDLRKIINEVFDNKNSFKITKNNISQSELFFKTVFIELNLDNNLKNIFKVISQKTDKRDSNDFKPHISLMYKKMPKKEKLEIIRNLSVKENFLIDKVIINAPGVGQNDFLDISSWRNVYEKKLNY